MVNIAVIEQKFKDLKERISKLRKSGLLVDLPDLMTMNLESKISYAKVANNEKDLTKIADTIAVVNDEIDEIDENYIRPHNLSRDFLEQELYEKGMSIAKNIEKLANANDLVNAKEEYGKLSEIYMKLPPVLKKKMHEVCVQVRKKIAQIKNY